MTTATAMYVSGVEAASSRSARRERGAADKSVYVRSFSSALFYNSLRLEPPRVTGGGSDIGTGGEPPAVAPPPGVGEG